MKIKVSNWFLLALSLSVATGGVKLFALTLVACAFHELGHILAMRIFSCKITELNLSFAGGSIQSFEMHKLSYPKQFIIYANGIFFNIILAYICNFIAMRGFHSRDFFMLSGINLILAFFNSLPIKILDGSNCLFCILMTLTKNYTRVQNVLNIVSLSINLIIIIAGAVCVKYNNFSLLLLGFFLLFAQKIKSK